jgi:hypothetical protein
MAWYRVPLSTTETGFMTEMRLKNPLYNIWVGMKQRCHNPNSASYRRYGGRGIKVCDRWLNDYKTFERDMGTRPPKHSIDRIDPNGGYSPENCRWADTKTQGRNKSHVVRVFVEGVLYNVAELAEISGLKPDTIKDRSAHNLTFSEIISPERRVFTEGLALGGKASGAKKLARTHCRNGHEFTDENTYWRKDNTRQCRICHNEKMRRLQKQWRAERV